MAASHHRRFVCLSGLPCTAPADIDRLSQMLEQRVQLLNQKLLAADQAIENKLAALTAEIHKVCVILNHQLPVVWPNLLISSKIWSSRAWSHG